VSRPRGQAEERWRGSQWVKPLEATIAEGQARRFLPGGPGGAAPGDKRSCFGVGVRGITWDCPELGV
jgi:hypothetical protein